jgi:hypothetical protein
MLHIRPHLPVGATVEDAAAMLAARPAVAATLASLVGPNRSRVRKIVAERYGQPVADALIPAGAAGRPVLYDGVWAGLSSPARADISDILGKSIEASTADDWTPEKMKEAVDVLAVRYENPSSAVAAIKNFRAGLMATGIPFERLKAASRSDLVAKHNDKIKQRTGERIAEGINVPPPYERIADLRTRVEAFIAGAPVSPLTVADFLVAFSARPGEAETIDIGPGGGVVGALKKRGAEDEFPIVSALGAPLATAFMAAWKKSPLPARKKAIAELGPLAATWGLQKRDLRAVGSALAVRAAVIAGDAENEGVARGIHRAALRHAAPTARPAQDHYQRVNDPVAQLCANIAELSVADRQKVSDLIASLV